MWTLRKRAKSQDCGDNPPNIFASPEPIKYGMYKGIPYVITIGENDHLECISRVWITGIQFVNYMEAGYKDSGILDLGSEKLFHYALERSLGNIVKNGHAPELKSVEKHGSYPVPSKRGPIRIPTFKLNGANRMLIKDIIEAYVEHKDFIDKELEQAERGSPSELFNELMWSNKT